MFLSRQARRATLADTAVQYALTVPFPLNSLWGTGTIPFISSVTALPTCGRAAKPAGSLQRLECLAQALILDPEGVSQLRSFHGRALDQKLQHPVLERGTCCR